jgi:cobalamin biosynthesis protein CobD/CbiB
MLALLPLFLFRAKLLALLTLIAFFGGETLAKFSRLNLLAKKFHALADTLGKKLNRPSRSVATRVYRGIAALVMLEIPALAIAAVLQQSRFTLLAALMIIALLGRGLPTRSLLTRLKQARSGSLMLEQEDALFADTHGVLRHTISTSGERFAVRVVGAGFWFVIGGVIAMFAYLVLAMAAAHYSLLRSENIAFGWVAARLYRLADMIPRLLTSLVMLIGGLCVPRIHPFRALRSVMLRERNWTAMVAELVGISLGGKVMHEAGEIELPWQGGGTAQLTAAHLASWLALLAVASLLWLLLLLSLSL